jgi:GTP-dependent phosphoenolpyruvate carboxykinase
MNRDTMNNQISSEQHLNIDNQQNDTKSKEINNRIKRINKSPMNPTPLYVYFFSLSIQHSNISLENIHGGQHIQLKQMWEYLFYS